MYVISLKDMILHHFCFSLKLALVPSGQRLCLCVQPSPADPSALGAVASCRIGALTEALADPERERRGTPVSGRLWLLVSLSR